MNDSSSDTETLRIGTMGAGAIGCYVGGSLAAAGRSVTLVGRQWLADAVDEHGLSVRNMFEPARRVSGGDVTVATDASALADANVVMVAVKSAGTQEAARQLEPVIGPDTLVVSLQNGLRNPRTLAQELPGRTVVAGIVSFNVVSLPDAEYRRTMDGPIQLQRVEHPRFDTLVAAMRDAGLHVEVHDPLTPHQWTKLIVNLNNSISALSGEPTVAMLKSPALRRIIAAVVDEALDVLKVAGIKPAKLRGVPLWLMPKILRLPTWLVKIVIGAQMKIDPEARSSMWEDLERGRTTEVDYLNGELVKLAEQCGTDAPLNRRIVEAVRDAEAHGSGSPGDDAEALWARLRP